MPIESRSNHISDNISQSPKSVIVVINIWINEDEDTTIHISISSR